MKHPKASYALCKAKKVVQHVDSSCPTVAPLLSHGWPTFFKTKTNPGKKLAEVKALIYKGDRGKRQSKKINLNREGVGSTSNPENPVRCGVGRLPILDEKEVKKPQCQLLALKPPLAGGWGDFTTARQVGLSASGVAPLVYIPIFPQKALPATFPPSDRGFVV